MTLRFSFRLLVMTVFLFSASYITTEDVAAANSNVPRFVSLSSDKVNVRVGPGKRYPISWVFVRSGWPVEVIAEYERWRQIRDVEGATGWIHTSLLSNRRMILITGQQRPVYEEANTDSSVMLLAEPGVQGKLLECDGQWCLAEIKGNKGWLKAAHFFGVLEDEKIR